RGKRLDADDLDAARIPGGDAGDQAAAAHRDQHRIDIRRLALELEAERSLSHDGFVLIEGRHRHGAGFPHPGFASGERIGVAVALDREIGAIVADTLHLGREETVGTKILAGLPSFIAAYATAA